ncbi:hypothetical protein BKI52_15930 [marine bacterium AO1-C]|nr:hypothetical protein BKI52_15930 [marine bacterium AO1-C]
MKKLYKEDDQGNLLYAEYWVKSEALAVIHTGKVGKEGTTEEFDMLGKFGSEKQFIKHFINKFEPKGYGTFPASRKTYLVVQFPMKSLKGNKRDHWLKEKVMEYLDNELGWRGLGHIDGFDMGEMTNFPQSYALNIFSEVVDEEKGVTTIKRCLRTYRLDYTRIKIASRPLLSTAPFELKYSAKKKDQTFSI